MCCLRACPAWPRRCWSSPLGPALGVQFERIQFTPDLLPSDVVGTMVFQPKTGEFSPHQGPIFANLVLADEINRAPAKVQSALLEAMQERQVTIGGQTHALPDPFFVMATQNPIEQEGTYPLPEAQTDRFLFKLLIDYPERGPGGVHDAEVGTGDRSSRSWPRFRAAPSSSRSAPRSTGSTSRPSSRTTSSTLVRATRALADNPPTPPPAGSISGPRRAPRLRSYQAGRALAWLRGLDYLSPALVRSSPPTSCATALGLTYEAEAQEVTPDTIVSQVRRHHAGARRLTRHRKQPGPQPAGAPAPARVGVRHAVENILSGEYRSAFRGRGIEFDQVVRYEFGDDVRDIDWNVTARLGEPYRKKFVEEREMTLLLVFEDSASLDFGSGASPRGRPFSNSRGW